MARPRSRQTAGLPTGVYFGKGRWYLRQGSSEIKLAPAGATKQQIWEAFAKVPAAAQQAQEQLLLRALVHQYQRGADYRRLSPTTKKDAERALGTLLAYKLDDGSEFGDVDAEAVTMGVIRRYLDARGEQSATRANREVAYLSKAYSWALEREIVHCTHPCKGVTRNNEAARDRYVSDDEYAQRYALAGELGRVDVQVMMEIAYLCRLRENEIVKMMDSPRYIVDEGVHARRGKGSKHQLINWSPRLEAAIALARSVRRRMPTPMLIVSPFTGRPLTLAAFASAWTELRQQALRRGQSIDWTFHDLKAKGVSDFDGDKHRASGHITPRMTAVYDRKIESVNATR